MSSPVIEIENISKLYRVGAIGPLTLQETALKWWYALLRKEPPIGSVTCPRLLDSSNPQAGPEPNTFWALKDVSFSVNKGEVIGIIGKNGAGKSTLLRILSRITDPTHGRIKIRGRVGSLLEVGTGFHPELTGRENIYLNGAILGMRKSEIDRKFDEIVEFAEVSKFIDTPVKRYSSGMYVRLAFGVAAHLEPEILVVDEVLAVGDLAFQNKCLGKMKDITSHGRTVLFVSHNMAAVQNLCTKAAFLKAGRVVAYGDTQTSVDEYVSTQTSDERSHLTTDFERPSWAEPYITSVRVRNADGSDTNTFKLGEDICIDVTFRCPPGRALKSPILTIGVRHIIRGLVGVVNTYVTGNSPADGLYTGADICCTLTDVNLLQGDYVLDLTLSDIISDKDQLEGCASFSVIESDVYGSGRAPSPHKGMVFFRAKWDQQYFSDQLEAYGS